MIDGLDPTAGIGDYDLFHFDATDLSWDAEDAVIERMRLDKKTVGGQLRFVLPKRIGQVEVISDVPEADVRAVLKSS